MGSCSKYFLAELRELYQRNKIDISILPQNIIIELLYYEIKMIERADMKADIKMYIDLSTEMLKFDIFGVKKENDY